MRLLLDTHTFLWLLSATHNDLGMLAVELRHVLALDELPSITAIRSIDC